MTAPLPLLMLNGFVAATVVIVVLYTLAVFVRCSIEVHQLKVETHRLRIAYFRRLAALRSGEPHNDEPIEVEIVEGAGDAPGGTAGSIAPAPGEPVARQAA